MELISPGGAHLDPLTDAFNMGEIHTIEIGHNRVKSQGDGLFQRYRKAIGDVARSVYRSENKITDLADRLAVISEKLASIQSGVGGVSAAQPEPQPPSKPVNFEYPYAPRVRQWGNTKAIKRLVTILDGGTVQYSELLDQIGLFKNQFDAIANSQPNDASKPFWLNGWFPVLDAMSLYTLVATRKPRLYIEVGSGNSTKFARQAIIDNGLDTKIVSVDPQPRAEIDLICDTVIRTPCENVDIAFFESLTSDDLVFIDNSHRSFQNSDVTVFFTEILPGLPKGLIVGIHDICLPDDYPQAWLDRYYNEQYLLACYIFGGMDGGKILLPNVYVCKTPTLYERLSHIWSSPKFAGLPNHGGAFWFVR